MTLTLVMVAVLTASYALMFALVRFSDNIITVSDAASASGGDQAEVRSEHIVRTAAGNATLPH